MRRSRIGTSISRTSSASGSTAMPRMIPISVGARPGQGEREEHGNHHGVGGGEDHAAGAGQAGDHRLTRVVAAVPVLLPDGLHHNSVEIDPSITPAESQRQSQF